MHVNGMIGYQPCKYALDFKVASFGHDCIVHLPGAPMDIFENFQI